MLLSEGIDFGRQILTSKIDVRVKYILNTC